MYGARIGSVWLFVAALFFAANAARADDPFYKGKRLTILINFAAGGPTDIEGRLFAKHLARHIDGTAQHRRAEHGRRRRRRRREVSRRSRRRATAPWRAISPAPPSSMRSIRSASASTSRPTSSSRRSPAPRCISCAPTSPPGMREPTDIAKAKGLVVGGLSVDTPKDIRLRLAIDMLGVPFKYVTGYRSSPAARLALPARRDQLLLGIAAELPRRGRAQLVKTGQAIPVFYDAGFDGKDFFVPDAVKGLPIPTFHELYQKIKGTMPSGQYWDIYKAIISADGIIQRMIVMPPGAPPAAVAALRAAHRAGQCRQGLRGGRPEGVRLRAALAGLRRHAEGRADRAQREARGPGVSDRLHEEPAAANSGCRPITGPSWRPATA